MRDYYKPREPGTKALHLAHLPELKSDVRIDNSCEGKPLLVSSGHTFAIQGDGCQVSIL